MILVVRVISSVSDISLKSLVLQEWCVCSVCNVHVLAMCGVQCTVYNRALFMCTMYNVKCTMYIALCTSTGVYQIISELVISCLISIMF